MKTHRIVFFIVMLSLLAGCTGRKAAYMVTGFGEDWLFSAECTADASAPDFDDAQWRRVELPHDWMIEDKPGTDSPFVPDVKNGVSSGFLIGGTAWYRKHFNADAYEGRNVVLSFDGVYMNSSIWVNGQLLAEHYYGYSPFTVDITDALVPGTDNVVAVRVDSPDVTSRWYSGAGIYRKVELIVSDPVSLQLFSTAISTDGGTASVNTMVANRTTGDVCVKVACEVLDADGRKMATGSPVRLAVPAGESMELTMQVEVENPQLWSPDSPVLYTLVTSIDGLEAGREKFGFREIATGPQGEFLLNGESVLLKGGCVHHDHGPIGAVALPAAEYRKVKLLKEAGFNAIRCSHNPPSTYFLEACDELGMLVIDEAFDAWRYGHFSTDYSARFDSLWRDDLKAMIDRDRNHPCVIMWSIGNEIKRAETDEIAALADSMASYVRVLDPDRPVTAGVNSVKEKDKYLDALDIAGYNYARDRYVTGRELHPGQSIFASESYAAQAFEYWDDVKKYPWVIGDFVWTAFDYIGEASIGWYGYGLRQDFFPWYVAWCGDIDICGGRRPQSWYRQSLWSDEPMAYISVTPEHCSFPVNPQKEDWSVWDWPDDVRSWNWNDGDLQDVHVYSGCSEVELYLNGTSLGRQSNDGRNIFRWKVPYSAGELRAEGYINGGIAATDELRTAGEPARLVLEADKDMISADGMDLCYVKVKMLDAEGNMVPLYGGQMKFSVKGAATLAGLGNADPMDATSFTSGSKKLWRGEALAIVRATHDTGRIVLRAEAEGGFRAEITVKAR